MADKFSRSNFVNKNDIDGNIENDLPFNSFNNFKFKRPRIYYTVKQEDILRPDLISLKFYGTMSYWWIILKVNNIEDVFNDMEEGDVLQLPDPSDIDDFYMKTRKDV